MKSCIPISAALLLLLFRGAAQAAPQATRTLAFQIFTGAFDSAEMRESIPQSPDSLLKTVEDIRRKVYVPPAAGRCLGFIPGPLAFDNTDEEARRLIAASFDIALRTDMAVGFHVDDSMFWGRLKNLNQPGNLEWVDWKGTPGTGRRLDWSSKPLKIMPQLCLNSRDVTDEVKKRAALIGEEVRKGLKKLRAAGKDYLFIGVIAGWETQIGRDFDTGKPTGYHALANQGFSAARPPKDFESARAGVTREFVGLWARSLANAGVPREKIYSHIAFMSEPLYKLVRHVHPDQFLSSYLETINATPPATAFGSFNLPGFSTYPQPGHLDQWQEELARRGNPPWASCEGTALDPSVAEQGGAGMDMEAYLGNLFNHGARLVNIYGWGVGEDGNPFRKVAEADASVAAYRKFLEGQALKEYPLPSPEIPSAALPDKMRMIQQRLPAYVEKNGPARVSPLVQRMEERMKQQKFAKAEKIADEILKLCGAGGGDGAMSPPENAWSIFPVSLLNNGALSLTPTGSLSQATSPYPATNWNLSFLTNGGFSLASNGNITRLGAPVSLDSNRLIGGTLVRYDLGAQYSHALPGDRFWQISLDGGYTGDTFQGNRDNLNYNLTLAYSFPASSNARWLLMPCFVNNGPFGPFIPVPVFIYMFHGETVSGLVGFPFFASLQWTPDRLWTLGASLLGPNLKAEIFRGPSDGFQVYSGLYWQAQSYVPSLRTNNYQVFSQEAKAAAGLLVPVFRQVRADIQLGKSLGTSIYEGNGLFNWDGGSASLDPYWYLSTGVKLSF